MEYTELIQRTIDYIDSNITNKFTVEELASITGFSTNHYYRVFHHYVGMPVMEYVTRRKLQFSIFHLGRNEKVLDIALQYGFETHAGFTKAFKKHFGFTPNYYRMHAPEGIPPRVNLVNIEKNKVGGIVMEPKIMDMESFKIVGYKFDTTLRNNAHSRDIPAFWDKCDIEGKEAKLYHTQNVAKHGEYGICINTNMETDEFSYVLGVEVVNFDNVLDDMFTLEVPAARYAVFTTPEVENDEFVSSIKGTWKYILEEWFPQSGYEIDEDKLDFEFYDEHCHPWEYEKVSMNIFIPIRKIEK
ncbi:MAG TPA: AraC family transcriptional regulator [Lachnospiraceae bacterium]|nr:AraC family transcriptional regulator [Lachnospiraceae bacterium]